jgi:ferrochelatase
MKAVQVTDAPIAPEPNASPPQRETAVLLVNLGTPEAPTPRAVRRYLSEFLHDHRVVSLTRWLWCPLLHFVILPLRGPKVAKKYAEIWMKDGSPLAVHTRDLAAAMQAEMPETKVAWAMRYGKPALDRALLELRAAQIHRVLVLPLYPQFSTTTTASVGDVVETRQLDFRESEFELIIVDDYHLDPGWVAAVADSIRAHWASHGRGERLLFSFHGIPQRLVDAGDPYASQCRGSVEAIVAALGMPPDEALLTFQSRFGREAWLQPYTDKALESLGAQGVKTVDAICPGFAVDCLETLEEISIQNAEIFRAHGGGTLRYIPCLNASPAHARALAALARRHLLEDENAHLHA